MSFPSVILLIGVSLLTFTGYATDTEDEAADEKQAIEAIEALGGVFTKHKTNLDLTKSPITDAELQQLTAAMPKCGIRRKKQ